MKKLLFVFFLFVIGNSLFAQVTDTQIKQAANTLGVPYEALKQFVDSYKNQPKPSEVIIIDSKRLSKEYNENVVKADTQYKGKYLRITGPMNELNSYFTGYEFSFADGIPPWHWVNVRFRNTEINKLANLSKGQIVTIIGICNGMSGNINIRDAVIVE
jgi:hypothetical protein